MKNKLLLFTAMLFLAVSFPKYGEAQFSVKKIEQITNINAGYSAIFTPNGEKILFSTENNNGISVFDLKLRKQTTLNTEKGSGFEPSISTDGKIVFYKSFVFDETGRRYSSIISQNIETGKKTEILAKQRNLSSVHASAESVIYMNNSQVKSYSSKKKCAQNCTENVAFTSPNMDLVVFNNGIEKVINPFGEGNYIWVSISPDKTKVLFNKVGKGTFVADLNGKIIAKLGRLHAAKWSADGKWIIGMNDFDDGHQYTSSKIVIASANGKTRQELELANAKIALSPSISSDNTKIVFNNEKGQIFILNLEK